MDYKVGMWVTLKHNLYTSADSHQPAIYGGTPGQIIAVNNNELTVNFCYDYREEFGNYIYNVFSSAVWTDDHYTHGLNMGDRVVIECHGQPRLANVIAARRNNGLDIGVQCDDDIEGHSCQHGAWWNRIEGSNTGIFGHCWWVDVNYVFKIPKNKESNYRTYYYNCLDKAYKENAIRETIDIPF